MVVHPPETNRKCFGGIAKIEKVFKSLIPSAPFDYTFADEEYKAKFQAEERVGKLAAVFASLAIFISCLGLFGLASFCSRAAHQRNWYPQSIGCNLVRFMASVVERICTAGYLFIADCSTHCLVFPFRLARKLRIPLLKQL
jgi:hypothetical protein